MFGPLSGHCFAMPCRAVERRARRHTGRSGGPEPRATTGATPAKQLDPCGVRHNRWQIDMVITVTDTLALLRYIRTATAAGLGALLDHFVRILRKRAGDARTRRARLLRSRLV